MDTNIQRYVRTGNGFKERLHVKRFKSLNDACEFLNKQDSNAWSISTKDEIKTLKTGIYAFAGGAWHNVKSLDASVLAHI
jgi:acyl-CoA reductase-like NAD-dependent aldehyde dehydrogenase